MTTEKLYRITWVCPKCDDRHSITDTLAVVTTAANDLLAAGIFMVAIYDETYAIMCDQDRVEALSGFACTP